MNISEKIKEIRKEKRISQRELATRLGVNQSNIVYFEGRGNSLTVEQCISIATALEVSVKELIFGENETAQIADIKEIEDLRKENERYQQENEINKKLLKDTVNNLLQNILYNAVLSHIPTFMNTPKLRKYETKKEYYYYLLNEFEKDYKNEKYSEIIGEMFGQSLFDLDYFFKNDFVKDPFIISLYTFFKSKDFIIVSKGQSSLF